MVRLVATNHAHGVYPAFTQGIRGSEGCTENWVPAGPGRFSPVSAGHYVLAVNSISLVFISSIQSSRNSGLLVRSLQ